MRAWEEFLTLQESDFGADTVLKWLRTLKVLRYDACNLYLEAKDSFQALWFEEHVRPIALTKLFNNNKKRIKIHLNVANSQPKVSPKINRKSEIKETPFQPPKFNLTFDSVDPQCAFENFIVDDVNKLPFKLLANVCSHRQFSDLKGGQSEFCTFNPIYIYGPNGTGKTHLLMATAQALQQNGMNAIYSRAETFTEHVVSAIRAGEMSLFRQAYRNIEAVLIDDVHIFANKNATQEEFFHTFNTLHMSGKQIILSSNCSPQLLKMIEPRLISRFEWGIVLPMELLTRENLMLMVKQKAQELNFQLAPKLIEFLLETFPSTKSISKALKALILRTHLDEYKGPLSNPSISIPQAKALLHDLIHEEQQRALTPERIVQHVADHFGMKPEDILGKAQSRDCVLPRQIAMFLCRNELKMPFTKIGDLFEKDHSTVMSSVKLIQKAVDGKESDTTSPLDIIRKKMKM